MQHFLKTGKMLKWNILCFNSPCPSYCHLVVLMWIWENFEKLCVNQSQEFVIFRRTVPNDLRFWLFMHFKKVSLKETVFNQSNCRKFEKCLFAQWDYFWIFWAKRLFSNFLPFDWLKTVSFSETFLKWKRAKTLGTVL